MEDPKLYGALLNGVMKLEYEGDESITPEFLAEAVFRGKVKVEIISKACLVARDLMARAALEDYDPAQLEAFFKLRKPTDMNNVQKEVFVKFWKAQRSKIHEVVRKRNVFEPQLGRIAWRIDVKTHTMAAKDTELSEPVAIVELHPSSASNNSAEGVARFEMDKTQLQEVLSQVVSIEKYISSVVSTTPSSQTETK